MTAKQLPMLLEPAQLSEQLSRKKLLIIDLSEDETYEAYHVPGAVHLSYSDLIEELPDKSSALSADSPLVRTLNNLGLTPKHHVIAYDDNDNGKACRLLWTLDVLGHTRYSLLNGGLHAWLDERYPIESGKTEPEPSSTQYTLTDNPPSVDLLYLLQHLNNKDVTIVDVRTEAEYRGEDLRAQRGGHIPGAINIDHNQFIDPEHSNRFKPEKTLKTLIKQAGIKPSQEVITYCQGHRRSALAYFVFKLLGYDKAKAYPGAWAEWGNNLDTPIE